MAAFSENLRRIRTERNLTQGELGVRAGITQATISRLEAGGEAPFARTVRRLAEVLGVQPSDLAAEDELNESKRRQPG